MYIYISFQSAQYADTALIFVDSDVFTAFYPRSLFKLVSQTSQIILEMIAVIKPCSSMSQTQTTKPWKENNKLMWLAVHNLLFDNSVASHVFLMHSEELNGSGWIPPEFPVLLI